MRRIIPLLFVLLLCSCAPHTAAEQTDTRLLMDTICTIRINGDAPKGSIDKAFDRIAEIQDITNYYSDTSDVAFINQAPKGEAIPLSDDMLNILATALDVCEKSNGAFDITVAPLKDLWDFSSGDHAPPLDTDIKNTLSSVGYKNLILDTRNKTLTKTADLKIDLGGAAKGYAADCAAAVLKNNNVKYAVIDLGGNIYAFGKNPERADGKWVIGIQKPFESSDEYSQTFLLTEGAVVTAGSYQRYFKWQGKLYHHILDTKTGYPADSGILGASIKSGSALLADCLSTACMVLGEEAGIQLAAQSNSELIVQ